MQVRPPFNIILHKAQLRWQPEITKVADASFLSAHWLPAVEVDGALLVRLLMPALAGSLLYFGLGQSSIIMWAGLIMPESDRKGPRAGCQVFAGQACLGS